MPQDSGSGPPAPSPSAPLRHPPQPSPAQRRGGGDQGRREAATCRQGRAGPRRAVGAGGGCHWPRRGATPARLPHASATGARRGYLRHPPAPPPTLRAEQRRAHAVRGAAASSALGPGAAAAAAARGGGGGRGDGEEEEEGKARPCARGSAASCRPWPCCCSSPGRRRRRALRPRGRPRDSPSAPRSRRGGCPCRTQVRLRGGGGGDRWVLTARSRPARVAGGERKVSRPGDGGKGPGSASPAGAAQ